MRDPLDNGEYATLTGGARVFRESGKGNDVMISPGESASSDPVLSPRDIRELAALAETNAENVRHHSRYGPSTGPALAVILKQLADELDAEDEATDYRMEVRVEEVPDDE